MMAERSASAMAIRSRRGRARRMEERDRGVDRAHLDEPVRRRRERRPLELDATERVDAMMACVGPAGLPREAVAPSAPKCTAGARREVTPRRRAVLLRLADAARAEGRVSETELYEMMAASNAE
jgi:hypothetical protein